MATRDPNLIQTLLARAHSPTSVERIYTEKIQHKPLLLKPTSPNLQVARRLQRQRKAAASKKKLKPKPLSSRQRRALSLYDVPRSGLPYETYLGLHEMWLGYIREILGIDVSGNAENGKEIHMGMDAAAKLCAADWHGAVVEVVRSKCVSRVGIKGVVVRDSRGVFEIVTDGGKAKMCPKEGTIFRILIPRSEKNIVVGEGEAVDLAEKETKEGRPDLVFELHGDQFIYRAADRANRKFKTHFLPNI